MKTSLASRDRDRTSLAGFRRRTAARERLVKRLAAVRAVKQWKYKPYLLNGVPVCAEMYVTVNFALSGH